MLILHGEDNLFKTSSPNAILTKEFLWLIILSFFPRNPTNVPTVTFSVKSKRNCPSGSLTKVGSLLSTVNAVIDGKSISLNPILAIFEIVSPSSKIDFGIPNIFFTELRVPSKLNVPSSYYQ